MKNDEVTFFIRAVFVVFSLIWMLVIILNKFYKSFASFVLFLPFGYFLIGFLNAECICDKELEQDVLQVTFIAAGMIISIPLLGLINKDEIKWNEQNVKRKEELKKLLNHTIFLAVIFILLSYPHVWVCKDIRHIYNVARSCLETFGVTLYIFALTIFFCA